jgi:hypothetical protein
MSTRERTQRTRVTLHMSRDVFDRVEGHRHLDPAVTPYAETQPEWIAPIRHEHASVVTPSGLRCHLRRAPRAELERHGQWEKQGADTLTTLSIQRVDDDTYATSAEIDDALTELRIGHDEVLWIDERALGFTPHTVMRQDDNGQDFEVETLPSRHAAAERVRAFEAAAHKQHYWLVPAPSHDQASLTYSIASWETLQLMLDAGRWDTAWEVVEVMEAPIEEVARHVWDHFHATNDFYEPAGTAMTISRRRKKAEKPPLERMERVLATWKRWSDEREAEAVALATSQETPVPLPRAHRTHPRRLRGLAQRGVRHDPGALRPRRPRLRCPGGELGGTHPVRVQIPGHPDGRLLHAPTRHRR